MHGAPGQQVLGCSMGLSGVPQTHVHPEMRSDWVLVMMGIPGVRSQGWGWGAETGGGRGWRAALPAQGL